MSNPNYPTYMYNLVQWFLEILYTCATTTAFFMLELEHLSYAESGFMGTIMRAMKCPSKGAYYQDNTHLCYN